MKLGGGKSSTVMFKKGDAVEYYGEVYEVLQSSKYSDIVVIKARGKRTDVLYVWAWKCRKV